MKKTSLTKNKTIFDVSEMQSLKNCKAIFEKPETQSVSHFISKHAQMSKKQGFFEHTQKSSISDESSIFDIFVNVKPFAILDVLKNKGESYISEVAREADCNYSHTHKVILFFEEKGIIKLEKQGKIRKVILTEKSNQTAEQIRKIKEVLECNGRKY